MYFQKYITNEKPCALVSILYTSRCFIAVQHNSREQVETDGDRVHSRYFQHKTLLFSDLSITTLKAVTCSGNKLGPDADKQYEFDKLGVWLGRAAQSV